MKFKYKAVVEFEFEQQPDEDEEDMACTAETAWHDALHQIGLVDGKVTFHSLDRAAVEAKEKK